MNKLEEYRMERCKEYESTTLKDIESPLRHAQGKIGYLDRWSDCEALDLPVKFFNWSLEGLCRFDVTDEDQWFDNELKVNVTTKEVFEYWIENIYKNPE